MKKIIPVVGFDPSLTHWGIAEADLNLSTGILSTPVFSVIEPDSLKNKQVRVNSTDLFKAEQLAQAVLKAARKAKIVFVEVPVGSQSARAMASYGVCIGILGAIRAEGIQLIEVTAAECKKTFTGNKNATKQMMINRAVELYPTANFPKRGGVITQKTEHVADALSAIYAGVHTPMFQNILRIYSQE